MQLRPSVAGVNQLIEAPGAGSGVHFPMPQHAPEETELDNKNKTDNQENALWLL